MERVKESQLFKLAENQMKEFKRQGIECKITPYFAYGSYGFFYDYLYGGDKKQVYTGLGTKRECLVNMKLAYYRVLEGRGFYRTQA